MTPPRRRSSRAASIRPARAVLFAVALLVGASCADDPAPSPDRTLVPAPSPVGGASAPADTPPIDASATTSPTTTVAPTDGDVPTGVRPAGFTTATVRITEADGTTCDVCMWLADDPAERSLGLMGVTDLGDAAGMAFVFERPTTGGFFMFRTVTPLSIAWFAADGAFVSSTDMEPCPADDSAACERFFPDGPYQLAVEVFRGDLPALGIGAGSRAEVLPGTEAPSCPLAGAPVPAVGNP